MPQAIGRSCSADFGFDETTGAACTGSAVLVALVVRSFSKQAAQDAF
jgi:hypothetical protein